MGLPIKFLLGYVIVFGLVAGAADSSTPRVSAAGKKRITENLLILQKNFDNARTNFATAGLNKATVEREIADIEGLEKDHLALKKKYSAYLSATEQEIKKNEKAISELEEWEKKAQNDSRKETPTFKIKFESVQKEKVERGEWKADAASKSARVEKLMTILIRNLQDIQSRKAPLRNELSEWSTREKDYQTLMTEMANRKAELEKMATK